jgi:hypothetical protein
MIYFVQGELTRLVKIGKSSPGNIIHRLAQMRVGSPDKLVLLGTIQGDHSEETWLHLTFAKHRVRGEWFNPDPAMMEFIGGLISGKSKLSLKSPTDLKVAKVKLRLTEEDIWRMT